MMSNFAYIVISFLFWSNVEGIKKKKEERNYVPGYPNVLALGLFDLKKKHVFITWHFTPYI